MIDEGVVKFDCEWRRAPPLPAPLFAPLERWRRRLFAAGLIGVYEPGHVGYGNLSLRLPDGGIVITGTQTGHLPELDGSHYTCVTAADIDANRVVCEGPVRASSETLTHVALYELGAACRAVFHVHDAALWNALYGEAPTSDPQVTYGTPAMARELQRLCRDGELVPGCLAVMGGHVDGLIAYGDTPDAAGAAILRHRPLPLPLPLPLR